MKKATIFTLVICFVFFYMVGRSLRYPPTYTIDGWQHGVAVCNVTCKGTEHVDYEDGFTMCLDGVMYTVNEGHMGDLQYHDLLKEAPAYCKGWRDAQ